MKPAALIFSILIGIAGYSFFNEYLPNDQYLPNGSFSNDFQTASVSQTVKTQTKTQNNNPTSAGEVKISNIQAANYYHPCLIRLSVKVPIGEKINLTSWKIKTRKGEIIIPKGIEKYQSHQTPRNIIIKEYSTIYLIGDENPLGKNRNFRINKCMGYRGLNTYCPKPKLEDVSHLNPECQEFILNLSNCEIPNYSNNMKISLDSKCTSYLKDNFSYSACFKNHSQDKDFLGNSWYIFINKNMVEPLHDTIYLYDPNGLLKDKYVY